MRVRFYPGEEVQRNSECGRSHDYFTTRGLICITVESVLDKVALRQLSDASRGPRKTEKKTTYGSVTWKKWASEYKFKNIMN